MGTVTRPAETVRTAGVCATCAVAGRSVEVTVGVVGKGMSMTVVAAGGVRVGCAEGVLAGVTIGVVAQALNASSKTKNKTWHNSQGTGRMCVMQ